MKKLPLIAGVVVGLAVLGGAAWFFLLKGGPTPTSAEKVKAGRAAAAELAAELKVVKKERLKLLTKGPTVKLVDEFVVNLAGNGLAHYAKFTVALQVDEGTPMEAAGGARRGRRPRPRGRVRGARHHHRLDLGLQRRGACGR